MKEKLDLKKQCKNLYKPVKDQIISVDVPPFNYLMVDGQGDPNTAPAFKYAVEALFSLSYKIMFSLKSKGYLYSVMPLEGLWWALDQKAFMQGDRAQWLWTAMILQPDFVTESMVEDAKIHLQKKGLAALKLVRFEKFCEGPSMQFLHIGPYSEEGPAIHRMHSLIQDSGHQLRGKHHEIYLSDSRRTVPEKLKTIVRQPYS